MTSLVTPTNVVPLSEYLATSYRPDCEYLDGELLERNVGEWDHSRLQMLLSFYLCSREKQWNIVVVPEQRVQVKPSRFRIPDILVMNQRPDGPIVTPPRFYVLKSFPKRSHGVPSSIRRDRGRSERWDSQNIRSQYFRSLR